MDLRLTHLDWNPEATLIHFQGQYLTICDLDYNILQGEIQNVQKTKSAVDIGEFCLVEDFSSGRWYRGRVQKRRGDLFDVFLIDHGNVLSVAIDHISSCSNDLFILPPKIVCGFFANVLLLQSCSRTVMEDYFSSLIGRHVMGYIQALLPHKVLLLEAPDINSDLVRHGFGRHVDTYTFLLLVEMLTEVPLKQNIEPVPDLLIEKPRGQKFCFKPSGVKGYEDILSFCGSRLSCGTHVKIRVTAAVNSGLLYCQMASAETDLLEMSRKLAAVCEHKTTGQSQKIETENLGLLCSVKGKDGKWYRGLVQCLPANSQVRVLFIDYGFFESVKVENVQRLPLDFYSAPIKAFPCALSSLECDDEVVRTQQLSFLKAGLLGGVLNVKICSFDEERNLYSITLFGTEDNRVGEPKPIQEQPRMKLGSTFERDEGSPQAGCLYYETLMRAALDKTLEVEKVRSNSVFVGYAEYVQNPNHFWMRTQKRNEEFEEMMTKMTTHFRRVKVDEDVLLNPEVGTLCCAVYEEDMHFYRCVVTDILDHGAEVLFIDFGNIEKVPQMLIKKIPEEFTSEPVFAFCCTLNIFPLDEVWTSAASDFFRQAVSNKALLVSVVKKRKNKFVVDLHEMGKDNNQSVTELLLSSRNAEYWNSSIEFVWKTNTHKPEKTRCMPYNVTSEQWEAEENVCKNGLEKAQVASFKALSIKPGCDFAVRCSYIKSPSDFWCQPLDKVPALTELMDKVQQYYSTHTVPLQSGDLCCIIKSPSSGKWHRAFVTEKQKGLARAHLVDYGSTIKVSEHHLQALMPEFAGLEQQAFRCSLYSLIEPADLKNCGEWSSEAHISLKDFVHESTDFLKCKVVSQLNMKNKGLCNVVDLYNTRSQQSITNVLVKQGLAREATPLTKQLSTVFPESFVYSSYDLSPGNEEIIYVTHVNSQWEVYCQLERNAEIIDELEKKVSEESEKMIRASTRAVVNNLCLAKYLDGSWYRGLAYPVPSPLHLSVFFVDYGNTNISEKTHVMFLPRDSPDLLYTPMQALRCHLASVDKEELYAGVKEWLDGAVLNKRVRLVIVGKSEDGSFDVELFDGEVNINEKVNHVIRSLSSARRTVDSSNASSTGSKDKTTSVKSKNQSKEQTSNSFKANPPKVEAAPQKEKTRNANVHGGAREKYTHVKQQNKVNAKRCVSTKPQKNAKQQRDYRDTNMKSPKTQHTKDIEVPQLLCLPDRKLSADVRVKCFTSHIDSVNSFFLQLSEDEPAILKMVEHFNMDVFRDGLTDITSVRIGDVVLAVYEEDGALYRSVVKDYRGSSCFKVEFIDYGNCTAVEKKNLYSIPGDYLSQPRLSIPCSLLETSAYENDAIFMDAVMEKPLMVEFVNQNGSHWEVKLEILDGVADLPVAFEAAVERSPVNETEEGHPAALTEMEGTLKSSAENYQIIEVCENEATKSERTMPVDDGPNAILKKTAVTLLPTLKGNTCSYHGTTATRNKKRSKSDQKKTSKYSVRETRRPDAFIPTAIHAKHLDNAIVLSVQTNGMFYIRPVKANDLFASLQNRIADNLYRCRMVAKRDVKQGLNCLAEVDNRWHRAVVQQTGRGNSQVFLVDHGIAVETSSGSLRRQCSSIEEIPELAVSCKVTFSEGEDAPVLWYQTLKRMTGKEVKVVFARYSEAENLWMVGIVMNGLFLVCQVTASLQQIQEIIPSLTQPHNEAAEGNPNMDTSPPQQLVFAPVHIDASYFGFAAAATTPFEFCVVLENLLLLMNKVFIVLDDLPGLTSPLPEAHLIPGTCCLFQSDSKNKWCRVEIVRADSSLVLHLVDYGYRIWLPYKDHFKLRRIPEELMTLPKVTYPCILRGVKPVGVNGQWTDEAAIFFQQCLYQKNLQIFFKEFVSSTHWKVDILADGVHVAKALVDAGHASYIDVMLELR